MRHPKVSDCVEIFDSLWPPALAGSWDSVGLAVGDPDAEVRSILLALDPMDAVIAEAVVLDADLVFNHHPLMLKPVKSVNAATLKGGAVHTLISNDIALFNAHTNADSARGGVSDVLISLMGIKDAQPLADHSTAGGSGTDSLPTGIGRVGDLDQPTPVRDLARRLADHLPRTTTGVRIAGDPAATVTRVAVCGGAGDSLFEEVRASGADVYVTADLRHHPATEALDTANRRESGLSLIDVSHWASETVWLTAAAEALDAEFAARGFSVSLQHSAVNTDPWVERY
ncbi:MULTISPECIES: Nif3-like dinuclear metal center hexameric protein [unclassified Brevibacterium]|uniref:Nif3-like dinuclear metal center hexameric protein n=1 Tax=unclassified Brevibacterium TaxID=2614124 RepID=UPI0010930BF4|nr:Nif3-like dinuclear metal center hexameric protein [Brevibacterium sp. S22]TGD31331.1 Nif3-like dinuclear metal center hexameric protein [Brevibacterium sp. S22]